MRVAATNNYSLRQARREAADGTAPASHMWGTDHLVAQGHDVLLLPSPGQSASPFLGRARRHLGQPVQEIASLLVRPDVAYAANYGVVSGLLHLPRRVRPPVVAAVHYGVDRQRLRGMDHAICLAASFGDQAREVLGTDRVSVAAWGPDLDYLPYADAHDGGYLVASGVTNRDYPSFFAAVTSQGAAAMAPEAVLADLDHPGVQAYRRTPDHRSFVSTTLAGARAVCIPLDDPTYVTTGVTELNDALAMGKPVIMTTTELRRDIDIEAIGCGWWVEPGDVDGWKRAIAEVMSDPDGARERGELGRAFAERSWNYASFGEHLAAVLVDVAGGSRTETSS